MRTILWSTVLSMALVGSVGCKKNEAEKVQAAEKNVEEQKQDIRDEKKDVVNEQKDVAKQQQELAAAQADLAQARAEYERSARERLAQIDAKIARLEAKGDAKSKQAAADLRTRRDHAAAKLNDISTRTQENWEAFKADVNRDFDQFEKDIDAALK
jgi:septal ring factor EnvC (AmiA/AmiB activator)